MITAFNRCRLAAVDNNRDLYTLRQALSEAEIPYRVKVEEQFCNSHNRGAGIDALAGERYQYIIYVRKQDFERARTCAERKETV